MQRWERDSVDPATVSIIVQRVAEGERLKQICRSRGWPYALVAQWVCGDEEVSKRYEQALRLAADEMAQETVAIADDADPEMVAHAKHRTDVRLKLAGKLYRDRYGEQVTVAHTLDPFSEMLRAVSNRRLAKMRELQAPVAGTEKDVTPVADPLEHDLI